MARPKTAKTAIQKPSFIAELQKQCDEFYLDATISLYKSISKMSRSRTAERKEKEKKNNIYVQLESNEDVLKAITIKNQVFNNQYLNAMKLSFEKFDTISTLRLQNCFLGNDDINIINLIIEKFKTLIDLNLDGNPRASNQFYVLLQTKRIQHLSLQRCCIENNQLIPIMQELCTFNDQTLVTINLAGNKISDLGALAIAKSLRSNRTLVSLILAGNYITDKGCRKIMEVLSNFELKPDEIVMRKEKIMNYQKRKLDFMQYYEITSFPDSLNSSCGTKSASFSIKIPEDQESLNMSISKLMKKHCPPEKHPFVKESYKEKGKVFCRGNFKLAHLNLAYCSITVKGMECVLNLVNYQKSLKTTSRSTGLICIFLTARNEHETCIINEISYMMRSNVNSEMTSINS